LRSVMLLLVAWENAVREIRRVNETAAMRRTIEFT
jgi:hypothetical protein